MIREPEQYLLTLGASSFSAFIFYLTFRLLRTISKALAIGPGLLFLLVEGFLVFFFWMATLFCAWDWLLLALAAIVAPVALGELLWHVVRKGSSYS
jgi:hypothetical protein